MTSNVQLSIGDPERFRQVDVNSTITFRHGQARILKGPSPPQGFDRSPQFNQLDQSRNTRIINLLRTRYGILLALIYRPAVAVSFVGHAPGAPEMGKAAQSKGQQSLAFQVGRDP